MIIVVPFSIDEPTKASWYLSVTADVNCICTVTAIFPPSPHQTCYGIRGGEDSSMTARGLWIMVDMRRRRDRLKMLRVEPGTHPKFRHALLAGDAPQRDLFEVCQRLRKNVGESAV